MRLIPSENWQENWKRNFKPLKLSSTLVICPTWEEYRPEGREKVLRLDPGQAFGTGGHASTRLCLKVLEGLSEETDSLRQPLTRVLDVGTGTGILALAAALFNARSVLAIDSDPLAVAAARLHVAINGLESIIRVEEGTAESVRGVYSLILANLTLVDLLPLAGILRKLLSPGGVLVMSGILPSQAKELIRAFVLRRLNFQCLYLEEEWAGVLFSKRRSIIDGLAKSLKGRACHSESFACCHSERSEESWFSAQDKLREESRLLSYLRDPSLRSG